ncbi:glycosyltransferase family 9 protein [Maridesulfovibrio ferrireducens]|uniref:glycosyltransferase family 9 protein n=1 Tax=Maridesulfovibrio ferrireducens TaxID=246191 RepID=UPI001A2D498C|nr:glycosyltransferase family 9 protein [Maridesulfovibrio ferrireducens]MBI9111389.1 glycosyltransferase family 9 protein [Maridesulfovibrio ferrireducens]
MKRVLIVQLTRFGDLVQTKRLILTLAKRGFEVHLCVDRSLKDLANIIYPDCVVHALIAHGTGISDNGMTSVLPFNFKLFQTLKSINFDQIYNLNFSPMNYMLSSLFDPRKVVGHKRVNGQDIKDPWLDMAFRFSTERRNNINIVDYWTALSPDMIPSSQVNPVAASKGGGIGVVMAGRESRRSLPFDVFAPLILSARSVNKNKNIFLLGSSSEKKAGEKLLSKFPSSIAKDTVNLAGKTDWKELIETVSKLDLLMTPDTGTMHLAAHLGTPVLGFFLSSAWCCETGPYGKGHTIIQADFDCSPCVESQPCYNNLKCLEPFKESNMARFIATRKAEHLPQGLSVFESKCDFLGTEYVLKAGHDTSKERRERIRRFIGCYLGLLDLGEYGPFPELAEKFYKEKDWITRSRLLS